MTPQQRITIAQAAVAALAGMTATRSITPAYLAAVFTKVIEICTDEDTTRSADDAALAAAIQSAVTSITEEASDRASADNALGGRCTALEGRCTTLEYELTNSDIAEIIS